MTDTTTLKTELGRIRGAITAGSFDRDTALDALDKAEKALDQPSQDATAGKPAERPQPARVQPASSANPVPEQVGKPFVPGGTIQEASHPHPPVSPAAGG